MSVRLDGSHVKRLGERLPGLFTAAHRSRAWLPGCCGNLDRTCSF